MTQDLDLANLRTLTEAGTQLAQSTVLALITAAESWTKVFECETEHELPYDFKQCHTHDRTFPLDGECDHKGLSYVDWLSKHENEQRFRAITNAGRAERAEARIAEVREVAQKYMVHPNYPSSLEMAKEDVAYLVIRALDKCSTCDGHGKVGSPTTYAYDGQPCPDCNGTGSTGEGAVVAHARQSDSSRNQKQSGTNQSKTAAEGRNVQSCIVPCAESEEVDVSLGGAPVNELVYTCQECGKTGTDRTPFKKASVLGLMQFSYILCNEHAKKHEKETL